MAARLRRSGFSPRIGPQIHSLCLEMPPPPASRRASSRRTERFEREAAQLRKGRGGDGGTRRGLEHLTETTEK